MLVSVCQKYPYNTHTLCLARSKAAVLFCALLVLLASPGYLLPVLRAQSTPAPQASSEPGSDRRGEPLAVFEGKPLYEQDLPSADQVQLEKMMQQVYTVQLRALHAATERKLIEVEAKRQGVTPDDLFKTEVLAKVADPTDQQVRDSYESRKEQINQPFETAQDSVRHALKQSAIQKAQTAYVQSLSQKALNDGTLVFLIKPPAFDVTADPSRLRGDASAPVTIVEFSDYGCPFCRAAESTMNQLLAKYPGKVKLSYRDFPLREVHPQAQQAAEAASCAGEQGKYWDYHDLLFAPAKKNTREDLTQDARTLKLDEVLFESCLASGRYKPQIDHDVLLGARAGVISTPGFFINGKFVSGAQPIAVFEKIINEDLQSSAQLH